MPLSHHHHHHQPPALSPTTRAASFFLSFAITFALSTLYLHPVLPQRSLHTTWSQIPILAPNLPRPLRTALPPSTTPDPLISNTTNEKPESCAQRLINGSARHTLDGRCAYARWTVSEARDEPQPPRVECADDTHIRVIVHPP